MTTFTVCRVGSNFQKIHDIDGDLVVFEEAVEESFTQAELVDGDFVSYYVEPVEQVDVSGLPDDEAKQEIAERVAGFRL